jgi:hypothetical protein
LTFNQPHGIIKKKRTEEIKKMTREEMMDRVIKKFGFEADITIQFCTLCEIIDEDATVDVAYNYVMNEYKLPEEDK